MKYSCMKISAVLLFTATFTTSVALADRLRNMAVGDTLPPITLKTLDAEKIDTASYAGKTVTILFLAGEQKSSQKAAIDAQKVHDELKRDSLQLLMVTADATRIAWFKQLRETQKITAPICLDYDRNLYGQLGLIVLPTTVIIDSEGKIARIMSSHKSDYINKLDAYLQYTLGDINDAQLKEKLEVKQFEHNRPGDRALRHRKAAQLLREKGLLAEAEQQLAQAVELDSKSPEIQVELASIYLMLNKIDQAATIIDQVLTDNPRYLRARLLRGVIELKTGKLEEAEKTLTDALLLNPDPAKVHFYLGMVYEQKGEKDKALEHYRQALKRVYADQPQ